MRLPATAPLLSAGPDLVLRPHLDTDIPAIVDQCRDPESQRWTTVAVPYSKADARWFVDHVARGWKGGAMAAFAVDYDGRFAGSIDLRSEEAAWAEVGFGLAA
jgi:RimJ/RimL family protein N-acetyltransferase